MIVVPACNAFSSNLTLICIYINIKFIFYQCFTLTKKQLFIYRGIFIDIFPVKIYEICVFLVNKKDCLSHFCI